MHTSFINEHTAELILVPDLVKILGSKYQKITPLYYWATREGGKLSRQSLQGKRIKVLALYPRRPKVVKPGCSRIQVKFNEVLFHRNRYFQNEGISTIAGVPLADSLESFHTKTACMWFEIDLDGCEDVFEIDLISKQFSSFQVRVLSPSDIIDLVELKSEVHHWEEVLKKIKRMGERSNSEGHLVWNRMSGDLYKPVYLLLHLD